MIDNSCPNHVQVYIKETLSKVIVRCHSSGMVAIFPESALAPFSTIVFLFDTPGEQLHAGRDFLFTAIFDQQMDMIRGDSVIQYR